MSEWKALNTVTIQLCDKRMELFNVNYYWNGLQITVKY